MAEGIPLKRQTVYSLIVGIFGCGTALVGLPELRSVNPWFFIAMLALACLVESMPVPLRLGTASLTPAVLFSYVALDGREEAILCAIAAAFVPAKRRHWDLETAFFNAGQYALSTLAMWWVLHDLITLPMTRIDAPAVGALVVSAAVFLVVNHAFVQVIQWLRGAFLWPTVWAALVTDLINLALCIPFALLVVMLNATSAWLAPVMVLPLLMLAYMLRSHRQAMDLQEIHECLANLATEFDMRQIALEAAHLARRMTLADCVAVFVIDGRGCLVPAAVYPRSYEAEFSMEGWPESEGGIIWKTIHQRDHVIVPDVRKDARVRFLGETTTFLSMAIFPMHAHQKAHGAIVCYAKRPKAFSHMHEYMDALANQVSVLLENAKLYQELQDRSFRDEATGLMNYRYFYEELARRVQASLRENRPVSVLIVDVDFFKRFNDTYGHLAGDVVLREVGRILERHAGPDGVAARYGGEEFAVLLWASAHEAFEVAEAIRQDVSKLAVDFEGYHLQGITVSIGMATCPDHSESDRDLLVKADSAMYWGAKQRGRNRTAMYAPEFDTQLFVDPLTSLYTHHFVNIRVRDEVAHGTTCWGVICLDLVRFSEINATYGFEVGDEVLRQAGVVIRQVLRHSELACRYGGDEMLIVIPNVSDVELAGICRRVTQAIERHSFHVGENILSVRVACGIEVYDVIQDGADLFNRIEELFARLHVPLHASESESPSHSV
ncbi:sensor domain-containing diguanylate cyclase [Alicyclobacillus sendaiensis]|uniref:sensor domain-containing diguanylate cyclase n=1 Tax=Alicyclobacillus sendaiensis TaxID=192387 RepID=UPI000786766D|nr:sensor domain-containing diguanylate cyclase [Alicyclobacillus sendaiensis]